MCLLFIREICKTRHKVINRGYHFELWYTDMLYQTLEFIMRILANKNWITCYLVVSHIGTKQSKYEIKLSSTVVFHHKSWKIPACLQLYIVTATDYGHSERVFFFGNPNFRAWADKLGRTFLGHLGYFRPIYRHRIFPLINHYFYKKLSLYIQIPNIHLGLRFEFGPQRIRHLAIVCP